MSKRMEDEEGWMKKADQFELQPSPALWKNIESDLQQHKRKRRIVLWFFVSVGLLLSSGIIYIFHQQDLINSVVQEKNNIELPEVVQHGNKNSKVENRSITGLSTEKEKVVGLNKERAAVSLQHDKPVSQSQLMSSQFTRRKNKTVNPVDNIISAITEEIIVHPTTSELKPEDTNSDINIGQEGLVEFQWEQTDANYCEEVNIPVVDSALAVVIKDSSGINNSLKDSLLIMNSEGKFSLQVVAMPLISRNYVIEHTDLGVLDTYRNESTKSLLTYAAEVRMITRIDQFLTLGIGLGYYSFGEQLMNEQAVYRTDTIYPPTAIFSNQYDINSVPVKILLDSAKQQGQYIKTGYQYLQIPVGLTVDLFNRNKFSIGLGADIIYLRLINSYFYEYDFNTNKYLKRDNGNTGQLRRDNFSFSANVSLNYRLSSTAGFFVAPTWSHFFSSIYNKQSVIDQKHDALGLKAGLTFYFK